jgi:hypothetical protein
VSRHPGTSALHGREDVSFHLQGARRAGLVNVGIVDRALFLESDEGARQGRLSLEVAKLSEGFFDALKKHPIPLEEAAIRALANNSAALDCYLWLAYRLHVLNGPKFVTWKAEGPARHKLPSALSLQGAIHGGSGDGNSSLPRRQHRGRRGHTTTAPCLIRVPRSGTEVRRAL